MKFEAERHWLNNNIIDVIAVLFIIIIIIITTTIIIQVCIQHYEISRDLS